MSVSNAGYTFTCCFPCFKLTEFKLMWIHSCLVPLVRELTSNAKHARLPTTNAIHNKDRIGPNFHHYFIDI